MHLTGPVLPSAVFAATYLLIAWPRLPLLPIGRPAAALLGAVSMVAIGALTPVQAYAAIDGNTLVLLVALMALSSFLEQGGLFAALAERATRSALSPGALLAALVFVSGGLSALLLNDTVCLFLTPVVCEVCVRRKLPLGPYLLALATSSNIGSAATLVGNPQNILIGSLGPFTFASYARAVAPAALAGLAANAMLLRVFFASALGSAGMSPAKTDKREPHGVAPPGIPAAMATSALATTSRIRRAPAWIALLVAIGYAAGLHLAFTTLCGVVALIALERREPIELFARVDWSLIVFFAALFVVVGAFSQTGLPGAAWRLAEPELALATARGVAWFTGYTVIGSNLFSNVPLVMLTGPWLAQLGSPERAFALLGFVSTIAGNLTLLGSVANLIVAERARAHHELGFFEYLRFGLASTALVLAIGVPIVCLLTP